MTGALICRGVTIQWGKNVDQSDTEDDIDWDTYDQSSCQWSLLIGQLEDISILDRSITNTVVLDQLYALPCDQPRVTLEYVLAQGKLLNQGNLSLIGNNKINFHSLANP